MNRDQIKKIIRLTEVIVNKRLNEAGGSHEPDSYMVSQLGPIYVKLNSLAMKSKNKEAQQYLFDANKLIGKCLQIFKD